MIPKKIHYVWVGGKEKPDAIKKCMKTWEKYLEGYEVIEWNETNFDIDSHPFVRAAYDAKKWAFVSDYIRAYAIYNEGGIYLDTDILMLDNLDSLLNNRAFVGYENPENPFTAVFGAEKNHPLIKDMLDYYDTLTDYKFNFENNNTLSVSKLLIEKYDCKTGNIEQVLKEDIKVYRDGVLCNPSNDSITIHVFLGSWISKSVYSSKIREAIRLNLNSKKRVKAYLTYKNMTGIFKKD